MATNHDGATDDTTGIAALLATAPERYAGSRDLTIGVEEEFALCAPESLELVSRFSEVEQRAREVGLGELVAGELLAAEVEFRTLVCEDFADAERQVCDYRVRALGMMEELGIVSCNTGTHPFADYRAQQIIGTEYYTRLVEKLQYVARRNNTFGLHVHCGINDVDRAVRVCDDIREYLPWLLALSASSPFLDGVDSGLASARVLTFTRTFPRNGPPPTFGDFAGYRDIVRWYLESGSIDAYTQMWWSVRPHLSHGTVEIRMFDGQPDVRDTLALTALSVGLMGLLLERIDGGERRPAPITYQLEENMWRATRFGTDAKFVQAPGVREVHARDCIGALVEELRGVSKRQQLGIEGGLDRVEWMLEEGSSSARQRALLVDNGGDLREVYRVMCDITHASAAEHVGAR